VQGLFAREAAFLRTPKTTESQAWWQAIRANWAETGLALLGLTAAVAALAPLNGYASPLLAGLLIAPTLGFAAAPYHSLAAQRASLPPDLRQRRTTEWRRERRAIARSAATGAAVGTLVGLGVVAALLATPAPSRVEPPQLVGPARKPPASVSSPQPSVSTTPTAGPTSPSGSTGPTGPTPSSTPTTSETPPATTSAPPTDTTPTPVTTPSS